MSTFDVSAIDTNFPIRVDGKPSYREGQREAIEFILNSFNNGKRVVVLEGPTGSGKSAVGMTVAECVDTSYYLTSTKILQDQLVAEFGNAVVELKGRNAYPCDFYQRNHDRLINLAIFPRHKLDEIIKSGPSCDSGFCKTPLGRTFNRDRKCNGCFSVGDGGDLPSLPGDMEYSACPYFEQVGKAVNGRKVVMNFSSFIYQTQMTKRFDPQRDLMVVDEAHNAEPQLLDYVSLVVSDAPLGRFNIIIPKFDNPFEYAIWFEEVKIHQILFDAINDARTSDNPKDTALADELTRVMHKYKMFVDHINMTDSEWVCEFERNQKTGSNSVTLKPVHVYNLADKLLFSRAKNILLMSATILDVDVMCKSLGLDRSQVAALRLKNRFPVENRPIYYRPVAKMTGGADAMGTWGPKLVDAVDEIVAKYPDKKGIIHTHNFKIQEMLFNDCSYETRSRLLRQQDFRDKKELLLAHAKSKNSVIIAPAMHEGIDLKDDLSRFQIICKIPYANCFDNLQLARRVEIDRKYYVWLTALKLVQSCGRSIRSMTDYADTYIVDESYGRFAKEAANMLPSWFLESVKS